MSAALAILHFQQRLSRRHRSPIREASMNKYKPLYIVLQRIPPGVVEVKLTFAGIEAILQSALPPSAWRHRSWWANPHDPNQHPYSQAWLAAGWEVDSVDQFAGWVVFRRAAMRMA